MPSKTVSHKFRVSNNIKIFAKYIFLNDYSIFGGHLGRHLEFLKTLKGAKPAPNRILMSNVSPLKNTKTFTKHFYAMSD